MLFRHAASVKPLSPDCWRGAELRNRYYRDAVRRFAITVGKWAGRCVDLIEIDAASRTAKSNTRDLLDNVRGTRLRAVALKVYLFDEVHMLSRATAFNALLKNAKSRQRM